MPYAVIRDYSLPETYYLNNNRSFDKEKHIADEDEIGVNQSATDLQYSNEN